MSHTEIRSYAGAAGRSLARQSVSLVDLREHVTRQIEQDRLRLISAGHVTVIILTHHD